MIHALTGLAKPPLKLGYLMNNYIPIFCDDVIPYPNPHLDYGVANRCQ